MKRRAKSRTKTGKRRNNRYGELVKLAIELSGRKPSTVYAVLRKAIKSKPVDRAIEEARLILHARRGRTA